MNHPYGETSETRLSTCSDAVQRVMRRAAQYLDISILCGHRGEEEQEQAFRDGFSKVRWPNSGHNKTPSDSVDAGIYRKDLKNVDYADIAAFGMLAGVIHVCAEEEGCVAVHGSDWDHDFNLIEHKFVDMPHWTILTREEYQERQAKK